MAQKTRGAKSASVITVMAKRPKKKDESTEGLTMKDRDKKWGAKSPPGGYRGDFYGEDEFGNLTKQ